MNLKNKTALVTGSSSGIGKEIAKLLVNENCDVILTSENLDELIKTAKELSIEEYIECDLTHSVQVDALIHRIQKRGKLDIIINNAGIGIYKNFEQTSNNDWVNSFIINVFSPIHITKGLLTMLKDSEKKEGTAAVINIGSGNGMFAVAGRGPYVTSKFALRGWSLCMSKEFVHEKNPKKGIKFCHLALGSTLTNFGKLTLEQKHNLEKKGKNYFTPHDVAKKVVEILKLEEIPEEVTFFPKNYVESYSTLC